MPGVSHLLLRHTRAGLSVASEKRNQEPVKTVAEKRKLPEASPASAPLPPPPPPVAGRRFPLSLPLWSLSFRFGSPIPAVAAGAPEVRFDRPLWYYVEDYIGFPVGSAVPVPL